jgi:hypothetical protein
MLPILPTDDSGRQASGSDGLWVVAMGFGRWRRQLPPQGRASHLLSSSRRACYRRRRRGSAPHRQEPLNEEDEEAGQGIRREDAEEATSRGTSGARDGGEGGDGSAETHYEGSVGDGDEGSDANLTDKDPISGLRLLSIGDRLTDQVCLSDLIMFCVGIIWFATEACPTSENIITRRSFWVLKPRDGSQKMFYGC